MFMMGILRMYLQKVMQKKSENTIKTQKSLEDARSKAVMMRSQKLCTANTLLTGRGFFMRKNFFCKKEGGQLFERDNDQPQDPMAAMQNSNPMMNPNNMGDMLKNNLFMTIITPIQFGFISYFFTGYGQF